MKNERLNVGQVWKQFEDVLAPRLRLSPVDRAVYSHLLRHSRLEGKRCIQFSMHWLARGVCLTAGPARWAVRRLIASGVLRLVERNQTGHFVEVRVPEEIPALFTGAIACRAESRNGDDSLEELDFMKRRAVVFTACARLRHRCGASTMWFRGSRSKIISTAIWSHAA